MVGIPKLRIEGFSDAWEQRKFVETFDFLPNNSLSRAQLTYENGTVKNVHYGDVLIKFGELLDVGNEELPYLIDDTLIKNYSSAVLKNGDVVIADAAEDETVGKCSEIKGIKDEKILSGLHTIPVRPRVEFENGYLGYFMNSHSYHDQLLPLIQGTKVSSISKKVLENTVISYPASSSEQEKIATFFENLTNLITLHQRKCECLKNAKKFFLQNMFPSEGDVFPKLRIAGFTDAWEQRKLGDVVERVTRKNSNLESNLPLTISAQYGLIDQNEFFDRRIASKDVSGYYLIKHGEFAYNKSTSNDAEWGAIKRLDRYEKGVLSTLYIVFKILDEKQTSSDFLATYYDTNLWHKGIQAIAAEGARNHGLLNIAPSDFFNTSLMMPKSYLEQNKIGEFFLSLNKLITLHQRKCDALKNAKKFFLQNMFV